jgi:hypothetical protein
MGKVRFQEREVSRAIRAADAAGREVSEVHIDRDGQVTLRIEKRRQSEDTTPDA